MSAVIKGQSDLFLYNIAANSYEQLTRDVYDDLEPAFLDNGKKIIFSSNRENDSLRPVIPADYFSSSRIAMIFLFWNRAKAGKTCSASPKLRWPMKCRPGNTIKGILPTSAMKMASETAIWPVSRQRHQFY